MKNKDLIAYLSEFDLEIDVKILINHKDQMQQMEDENILYTSETAHVDDSFPEDEWDHEDGKIVLGDGSRYLLINTIIN